MRIHTTHVDAHRGVSTHVHVRNLRASTHVDVNSVRKRLKCGSATVLTFTHIYYRILGDLANIIKYSVMLMRIERILQ